MENENLKDAWEKYRKLHVDGDKLWDEGSKLRDEGNKLHVESYLIWINAWRLAFGKDSVIDWDWGNK